MYQAEMELPEACPPRLWASAWVVGSMDGENEPEMQLVEISEETAEWVLVVAETIDESEIDVVEQCCRHGLTNYEDAFDLRK